MNTAAQVGALSASSRLSALFNLKTWGIVLGGILLLVALYYLGKLIYQTIENRKYIRSPENQARIRTERLQELNALAGTFNSKQPVMSALQSAGVPAPQQLLINTAVQGVRLAGYLGPYSYGVFDEDNGVRLALATGARCLILEIDHLENSSEPVLLYRAGGLVYSMNTGSIAKVAKSIAARAFRVDGDGTPDRLVNDPLIVVTYLARAPPVTQDPRAYIKYLGKIAQQLQPLTPHLLGMTPQGDFRRQTNESQLFFYPPSMYNRKIIHLTNADTSMMRNLAAYNIKGSIGPDQDLDLMVHARLYAKESPCPLGITSFPTEQKTPAAVLTTPIYWLTIPPERVQQAINDTKKAWTLVMEVTPDQDTLTAEKLLSLYKTYGVH